MSTPATIIDRLRVATPCPVSWNQMSGDNRVRFCDHCQLNVYNISELNRTEAEALIASTEGRICARLYRRVDGTVLTKDCPVGLRALRLRVSKRAAAVFAAIASITTVVFGQQSSAKGGKTACTPQTRITRTTAPPEHAGTTLSGTVLDTAGAVIPGAKVTTTNADTGEIKSTSANDEGRFEFASLTPATYSIKIEALAFKTLELLSVSVEKDKLTNLDTILQAGEFLTGVVVVMDPVDTTPGTTIINQQMIRRLPIQK